MMMLVHCCGSSFERQRNAKAKEGETIAMTAVQFIAFFDDDKIEWDVFLGFPPIRLPVSQKRVRTAF